MTIVKKVFVPLVVLAGIGLATAGIASADDPITPDDWEMDDGIGVGLRTPGTPCLASESHQWAENPVGDTALWCPPPAFVWVPVAPSPG
ncbi:hypothetical protein MGALJ_19810 [Mycobacterium gallinarum]|uniref:Secreted protein n=1 Tax=Mycobacterium gallinarum TaxID=39689 RepID=A0A9W4BDR0_9MYCO|nr:hypothetical protein [Mycobacterium gallinarum]BBY92312.1 hypothetical protein MGALJ_19810 [Mycobacterium gallinarum]